MNSSPFFTKLQPKILDGSANNEGSIDSFQEAPPAGQTRFDRPHVLNDRLESGAMIFGVAVTGPLSIGREFANASGTVVGKMPVVTSDLAPDQIVAGSLARPLS